MRRLLLFLSLVFATSLSAELRLEVVRHSLTGTHCRYREYIDGVMTETYVTKACSSPAAAAMVRDARRDLIRAGDRVLRRIVVEETPLAPFAFDYDVATGELVRRIPLFFHGKPARVFAPNPVVTLNDPTLQDRNDAASAVPPAAYRDVELQDVVGSGALRGPHVASVDRQPPAIPPPTGDASLVFDRAEEGFEYVNAYHHVDRSQRHLQALGYAGERRIVPYAIDVDAHAASGSDNSFFIPSNTQIGIGTLYFGDGGTDDAEDADLVVHEYGHAILEWIAPGTFAGPYASQPRALSEGFGDYWAYSAHVAERLASGRDPFCFADWDARCWEDDASQNCGYPAGSDCLRRLDSARTMADYEPFDVAGVEHRNGAIWSSALRDIHQQLGRTVTDTIVIESLFGVPPDPSYAVMAQRMIDADALLFGGAHRDVICGAMAARGIVTMCSVAPRGEQTLFPSAGVSLPIPENSTEGVIATVTIDDPRTIERVFVRVDIEHPSRGDLRIELVAPDGTRVLLQEVSFERGADVRTTFGLTAAPAESLDVLRGRSAAGTWQLVVRDLRARDLGTLLTWGVIVDFAGDAPPATRPRAAESQMIPVVARVYGVGLTTFASDLRIANLDDAQTTATLILTPSGADGSHDFHAIDVVLAPGQTVALDDVVASAFATTGSGSLEILGDVVAMSRTYAIREGGTVGQQVPPVTVTTGAGEPPLHLFPLPLPHLRTNLGFVETSGRAVSVDTGGGATISLPPFGHLQLPWSGERVVVAAGEGRVAAYVSQVNEITGDAMFIPAEKRAAVPRTVVAPVISAGGIRGSEWRSDVWFSLARPDATIEVEAIGEQRASALVTLAAETVLEDVLARLFHRTVTLAALRTTLPAGALAGTRVRNGGMSQFIPFRTPGGPERQELLFVETGAGYRTNIGVSADEPFLAVVVVFGAAGEERERLFLSAPGGVIQRPVQAPVTHGRASVRFLSGRGRAWASLVDNRTGDATYIDGQ